MHDAWLLMHQTFYYCLKFEKFWMHYALRKLFSINHNVFKNGHEQNVFFKKDYLQTETQILIISSGFPGCSSFSNMFFTVSSQCDTTVLMEFEYFVITTSKVKTTAGTVNPKLGEACLFLRTNAWYCFWLVSLWAAVAVSGCPFAPWRQVTGSCHRITTTLCSMHRQQC